MNFKESISHSMKKRLSVIICIFSTVLSFAQVLPTFQWAKSFGAASNNDVAYSIAVDGSGNVYTTGSFSGTVDFDPGAGTYTLASFATGDIFVSKLDAAGAFVWAVKLGGAGAGSGNGITTDAAGNVYITGTFIGMADFDPGVGTYSLNSFGGNDVFVCKLNSSSAFIWARQLGGPSEDISHAIAVDGSGNVYTTGTFQGGGDYDPGFGTFILNPTGNADCFVSKLSSSGAFVWAKQLETSNTGVGNAIAVDATGNVFTTGYFSGSGDFDPGPGVFPLIPAGSLDLFVWKLNSSGALVWAKMIGGTYLDYGTGIALDATGNIYTTGTFQNICDFDPGPGTFTLSAPGGVTGDAFVCKLNSAGAFVWAKQLGGSSDDNGYSIALDVTGNVYTSGSFNGTGDFDPGVAVVNLTSAGSDDAFISKLDPAGNFMWAKQLGGSINDISEAIAVDALDNVYTTGFYNGSADFDPGVGTFSLTSLGGNDIFVQKMIQCPTPSSPTNITLPANQNICSGTSASLSASGSGTINWFSSPSGTTVLGTGTTFITPTLGLGTYTFYAEVTTCTVNPARTIIGVTVTPLPVFSASTSIALLCIGQTATLYASGVTNCTWTPGAITGTAAVVAPTVTTTYTASGSNGIGCANNIMLTQSVKDCNDIGIHELTNSNTDITIYPNPFNTKVTLVTLGKLEADLQLYNSLGSLIYKQKITNDKTEIDLTELQNGIYFVKIDRANSFSVLKLVKE